MKEEDKMKSNTIKKEVREYDPTNGILKEEDFNNKMDYVGTKLVNV